MSTNGDHQDAAAPAPVGPEVGICCSGGGIRAAAYTFGCLQVLDEYGVLRGPDRASYISAVSGGSYAVGAAALVQESIEAEAERAKKSTSKPKIPSEPGPYAQDSPELHRLRNDLGYLTHGPGGVKSELWRALMGAVMNVALFGSVAVVIGILGGWVYGWSSTQLRSTCRPKLGCSTSIHTPGWTEGVAIALAAIAIIIGLLWVGHRWSDASAPKWQAAAAWAVMIAVAWALTVLALPQLLAWLHRASLPASAYEHTASLASKGLTSNRIAAGGLVGIAVAIVGVFRPAWRALGTLASNELVKQEATHVFSRVRRFALSALTLIAVPLFLGGVTIAAMHHGAEDALFVKGSSWTEVLYFVVPVAFLVIVYFLGDLNAWSLHSIYRARLADAFAVERVPSPTGPSPTGPRPSFPGSIAPGIDAQRRSEITALSRLNLRNFPEVLICATSNIRNYGLAPSGMGAAPFIFSPDKVGGPVVGKSDTDVYEEDVLRTTGRFSVMDAVSISGAAVAPQMGKMTRAPLRSLMALANVRLGVWIPKPRQRPAFSDKKPKVKPPGLLYLLVEAFGTPPERARHVYVTDGGHYDNLGLVELLRRRCEWIWCIDASGDKIDTFTTLGEAIAIAQAEHGVTVNLEPVKWMAPDPEKSGFVKHPFCWGDITYPPLTPGGQSVTGKLVVVKAGVPEAAPWAVGYYRAAHDTFPSDSTINQLYTAERFDAYLALGRFSMEQAWEKQAADYAKLLKRKHDVAAAAAAAATPEPAPV